MKDVELKTIIDDLIKKFTNLLNVSVLGSSVSNLIIKEYQKGLEKAEVQFDMNFIQDPKRVDLMKDFTFENIKGMNDELADKLRKELTQGLMNLESVNDLKDRVKKVMNTTEERARLIARTESHRALNQGHIDGARQSGLNLMKQWDATNDKRTCPLCAALDGKTIPMDKKFKHGDKELDSPANNHPRCRCTLKFIQKD